MIEEEEILNEVVIEEYYDGFAIIVNGKRFLFDQEDTVQRLQDVFAELGVPAEFEEVY
jgi:hypothetical protein